MNNQFSLLRDRRGWPLLAAQFTGAFNDNLFKTALSVLIAYRLWDTGGWRPEVVVSMTMGTLVLPFVLFAPIAGDLADKYDKARLLGRLKYIEMFIAAMAAVSLFTGSAWLAMFVLFAFGCQAAFFSPGKYAILPQHLEEHELVGGNALLNTGTYLAILAGMILGALLAPLDIGRMGLAFALIVSGYLGYKASKSIPHAPPPAPGLMIEWNIFSEIIGLVKFAWAQNGDVFRAIIGCSWFYFVGATVLAQFPNFTHETLNADNVVLALFLCIFSVGISVGGLVNEKLLRGKVEARFAPGAAVVMALCLMDLWLDTRGVGFGREAHDAWTVSSIFRDPEGWRVMLDLIIVSIAGGVYVVPLKSVVQNRTPPGRRARLLAAAAMIDSLFILGSSLICSVLLSLGIGISGLFLLTGVATLGMASFVRKI